MASASLEVTSSAGGFGWTLPSDGAAVLAPKEATRRKRNRVASGPFVIARTPCKAELKPISRSA
jgi:hypothetical protein